MVLIKKKFKISLFFSIFFSLVFILNAKAIDQEIQLNTLFNELKNYEKAIKSYKNAQKIYPLMKSPDKMINQIEILIKKELI